MLILEVAAVGALFGGGVYLLLARDILRMVAGTLLLSNSVILFILSAGFRAPAEPIAPLPAPERVSDPLVQALALTAIVIGFGVTALLLKIGLAIHSAHGTLDPKRLASAEAEATAQREEMR